MGWCTGAWIHIDRDTKGSQEDAETIALPSEFEAKILDKVFKLEPASPSSLRVANEAV